MRIVILGAGGMLGTDLRTACERAGIEAVGFDLPQMDITDAGHLEGLPVSDWLVNCAAYTQVDKAEEQRESCRAVNATGPALLADYSRRHRVPLLHISTDYVFDGCSQRPYRETDETRPLSVYGATKLEGEEAIRRSGCSHLIARTQSLYGRHGPNFVDTMLRLARENEGPLRVVEDHYSCPTWSVDLADALICLMERSFRGTVHVSSEGACSWYEFACAFLEQEAPGVELVPVPASQYPRPARRPAHAVLDKGLFQDVSGRTFPHWREAVERYLAGESRITREKNVALSS